jgi:hypothetical protein
MKTGVISLAFLRKTSYLLTLENSIGDHQWYFSTLSFPLLKSFSSP